MNLDSKIDKISMSLALRNASSKVAVDVMKSMPESDLRIIFRKSDFKSNKGLKYAFKAVADFFDTIRNNENLNAFIMRMDDDENMCIDFWMSDHEAKAAILKALEKKGNSALSQFRKF